MKLSRQGAKDFDQMFRWMHENNKFPEATRERRRRSGVDTAISGKAPSVAPKAELGGRTDERKAGAFRKPRIA